MILNFLSCQTLAINLNDSLGCVHTEISAELVAGVDVLIGLQNVGARLELLLDFLGIRCNSIVLKETHHGRSRTGVAGPTLLQSSPAILCSDGLFSEVIRDRNDVGLSFTQVLLNSIARSTLDPVAFQPYLELAVAVEAASRFHSKATNRAVGERLVGHTLSAHAFDIDEQDALVGEDQGVATVLVSQDHLFVGLKEVSITVERSIHLGRIDGLGIGSEIAHELIDCAGLGGCKNVWGHGHISGTKIGYVKSIGILMLALHAKTALAHEPMDGEQIDGVLLEVNGQIRATRDRRRRGGVLILLGWVVDVIEIGPQLELAVLIHTSGRLDSKRSNGGVRKARESALLARVPLAVDGNNPLRRCQEHVAPTLERHFHMFAVLKDVFEFPLGTRGIDHAVIIAEPRKETVPRFSGLGHAVKSTRGIDGVRP
mmetsp:Transcript_8768/g.20680  ORF Transcript_8768/g.20680 Transcript_8768/m.20680 type:complete len:428 (-) Transcript_8768:950-2233(-)